MIESIRQFDPTTQRTIATIESVTITPSREFLISNTEGNGSDGEAIDEFLIPVFHKTPATILDYLPKNCLIVLDNLSNIQAFGEEIEEQAVSR